MSAPTDTKAPTCDCDDGKVWLTEQDILDELRSERGTGRPVSFSFGFGGRQRTWRACSKCPAGKREATP